MLDLKDMTVGQSDKVAEKIVELFLRESDILQDLPFDNAVSPSGGSTLVYGYVQEKLPSMAGFRAIGQEYTPNNATVEDKNVKLKIFGGSFQIDRVLKTIESKFENMDRQVKQKVKGSVQLFHDTMINGDVASNALGFDGLDKFLVGTSTELNTDEYIDLSTDATLKANASKFYEKLKSLINKTNADAILVNEDMKLKIESVAAALNYKTESEEAFGRTVTKIGSVKICDLKNKVTVSESTADGTTIYTATETPIIGIKSRELGTGSSKATVKGLTDIYAVKYSIEDGFCGVTITGDKVIDAYLPDFTQPGAVKTGEVEMVAAVALKSSKSAGVLRNIKII